MSLSKLCKIFLLTVKSKTSSDSSHHQVFLCGGLCIYIFLAKLFKYLFVEETHKNVILLA